MFRNEGLSGNLIPRLDHVYKILTTLTDIETKKCILRKTIKEAKYPHDVCALIEKAQHYAYEWNNKKTDARIKLLYLTNQFGNYTHVKVTFCRHWKYRLFVLESTFINDDDELIRLLKQELHLPSEAVITKQDMYINKIYNTKGRE